MWKLCSSFWFHPSKCEMETLMVLGKMLLEGFDPLVPSIQRKIAFLEETQAMSGFYLKQILISLVFLVHRHSCVSKSTPERRLLHFLFTNIHLCQRALLRGSFFKFCSQAFMFSCFVHKHSFVSESTPERGLLHLW